MICKKCSKEFQGLDDLCPECRANSKGSIDRIKKNISDFINDNTKAIVPLAVFGNPVSWAIEGSLYLWSNDDIIDPKTGHIKADVKYKVRTNFKIDAVENIVHVRDTSMLKTRDKGVVITDKRIYYRIDNNEPCNFRLDSVANVEYKDMSLMFFFDNNETRTIDIKQFIDWTNDSKAHDRAESFAVELRRMILQAREHNNPGKDAEAYARNFLKLPYPERRLLVFVEKADLKSSKFSVLHIRNAEQTGIVFPMGYAKPYQLYIGHPFRKNKYYRIEDYELEIVKDKLREFCHFAQCLGATKIHISFGDSASSDQKSRKNTDVSGGLSKDNIGEIDGSYHKDRTERVAKEISKVVELHQDISATGEDPYVPDDVVWFHHEESWQDLFRRRKKVPKGFFQTIEKIQTSTCSSLDSTELTAVKGEFKSIYINGNGAWNQTIDESFSSSENVTLTIDVTFNH